MSYTPYGEKVKSASTGPDMFHQKYTAQVDDGDDAGLLYYNARYYDPVIGRFISADSVVPGAGNSQAFNRYMYVKGNPVRYNDPSGHFSMGGVISAVAGAVVGGVTGAAAGYGAYKAYQNRDKLRSSAKDAWHSTKNFVSEHKQGLLTGAGALLGGPVWGAIGALYGYAAGSDGGIKQYWQDNQWFRITTYVLVTVAVIAACVFLGPVSIGGIGLISSWALIGACAGAAIGAAYGGTNGFQGGWSWEGAAQWMMFGAISGALIGETANSYYTFASSAADSGNGANALIAAGQGTAPGTIGIEGGGLAATGVNAVGNSTLTYYSMAPIWFFINYQVLSTTYSTYQLYHNNQFTYVPGVSYDLD